MEKLKSSNFTMQDLASEADTSIGSLYHFFKYKKRFA
ncbi:TetR family transcriptional regulator [Pseudomonas oryzihabitans]